MTKLFNDPARFTEDMLVGFLDANATLRRGRSRWCGARAPRRAPGKVAVVIGGGSGHYPAFCGTVGTGFADGAVVGNIFTSPSAEEAASVARAAHGDAGVLLTTGNYAGDVMNFGLAVTQLRSEGIDAHYFAVTDDIASAPTGEEAKTARHRRRFHRLQVRQSAAAEDGLDLAGVIRVAEAANAATRTLGVAFDGCTLPGADEPLFTVPEKQMGVGLGIHGEPGVSRRADADGSRVWRRHSSTACSATSPHTECTRIAVILNGLGPHQVRRAVRGVGHRGAAAPRARLRDRRTRGGRAGHQPRHGGLLADRDVARRRTREVLDGTGRHAGLPQGRRRPQRSEGARRTDAAAEAAAPRIDVAELADDDGRSGAARSSPRRSRRWPGCSPTSRTSWAASTPLRATATTAAAWSRAPRPPATPPPMRSTRARDRVRCSRPQARSGPPRPAAPPACCGARCSSAIGARLGDTGSPDAATVAAGMRDGYDALIQLGGASPGDKTMLDAHAAVRRRAAARVDRRRAVAGGVAGRRRRRDRRRAGDRRAATQGGSGPSAGRAQRRNTGCGCHVAGDVRPHGRRLLRT